MELATFTFDVTPPIGHSLLGGLIAPARKHDDPLRAAGVVLVGSGLPIVLCAVDWCGIANEAHMAWREALAVGAGTTSDRVLVHAVHQHNTPFACLVAARLAAAQPDLPPLLDQSFFDRCLEAGRQAVQRSLQRTVDLTSVAFGTATVDRVASNRRFVGADGRIAHWRPSSSRLAHDRSLPEGLIDPTLRTVAFFSGAERVAALHFYATHPISYYRDGRVTADFVGLARRRLERRDPGCLRVYFTGCAGDVAAGRYNDGSWWARRRLAGRVFDAMYKAEAGLEPRPIERLQIKTLSVLPRPRVAPTCEELESRIGDSALSKDVRIFDAFELAWRRRLNSGLKIPLASLRINNGSILSLPGECFVEYQLRAQSMQRGHFVAVAAYSDGGPWYIPTAASYEQGGYEVERALCAPDVDAELTSAIAALLGDA